MRIIATEKISGMVKIYDAFEVPACIVMEYIPGHNLEEAMNHSFINEISTALEILVQIGTIVHRAHRLERTVFHRDLKPANILLKNKFSQGDEIEVIVVDFDLSWHKGAPDVPFPTGARQQGYASPEQTMAGREKGLPTRLIAVDTFGYGMLGYFIFVGEHPRENTHLFANFKDIIEEKANSRFKSGWKCLIPYIAILIEECTKDNYKERIDFAAAVESFKSCLHMAKYESVDPTHYKIVPFEIGVRAIYPADIRYNNFKGKMEINNITNTISLTLELVSYNEQQAIHFSIIRTQGEHEQRSISKYFSNILDKSVSRLREYQFENIEPVIGYSNIRITGYWVLNGDIELNEIHKVSSTMKEAIEAMRLS